MIDQLLVQGGAMGMIAYLIYWNTQKLSILVENNTKALINNQELIKIMNKRWKIGK